MAFSLGVFSKLFDWKRDVVSNAQMERERLDAEFAGIATGLTAVGGLAAMSGVATPAGGSSTAFLPLGTTAGFGLYYGSGPPTVTAAQGSIYLRSDGSSASTRVYVNTTGSTVWTNVTTAA